MVCCIFYPSSFKHDFFQPFVSTHFIYLVGAFNCLITLNISFSTPKKKKKKNEEEEEEEEEEEKKYKLLRLIL